jgi:hypothetical protein
MSKVLVDQIEKRTGGTAMDVPASGKWTATNIANDTITNTQINASAAIAASKLGTGVGKIATVATWTAAQRGEVTALTSATTVTIDLADSNNFSCTMAHNITFANPTNAVAGQSGSIFLTQDGTGSRTGSWGANWDWAGGTAPTLTTTAAAVDRIDYVVRSATSIQAVATLALA